MIQDFIQANPLLLWQIGKFAGIAAFITFSIVVCMGLLMTSNILLKLRLMFPSTDLALHSFTATFVGLGLMVLHIAALVYSPVVDLEPKEALVPFYAENKFVESGYKSFSVTAGIVSMYIALLLIVTARLRNYLPKPLWRGTHYLSFLFYLLILYHAYNAGVFSETSWMKAVYLASVSLVSLLTFLRVFAKKYFTPHAPKPANNLNKATV